MPKLSSALLLRHDIGKTKSSGGSVITRPSVNQTGLVGEFLFNLGTGTAIVDQVAARNGSFGASAPTWDGTTGLAFASGNYVDWTSAFSQLGTASVTVQVVFKINANPGATIALLGSNTSGGIFEVRYNADGTMVAVAHTAGGERTCATPALVAAGTPFLFTGLFNSGVGVSAKANSFSLNTSATTQTALATKTNYYLARVGTTSAFAGEVYYAAFYNRALTNTEINANYTAIQTYLAQRGVTI